ncbi:MAG TPA: hypothetical protein VF503_12330, partial [Sphingobium sp.]|uniref:hypothetical protein n=1 Tax=Sphingobium sp. TaxID=1912891 RepID=UPI002ED04209
DDFDIPLGIAEPGEGILDAAQTNMAGDQRINLQTPRHYMPKRFRKLPCINCPMIVADLADGDLPADDFYLPFRDSQ